MENQEIEPIVTETVVEEVNAPVSEEVVAEKPKKKTADEVLVFALKGVAKAGLPDINPGVNKLSKSDAEAWMALKSYITLYEGDK